MQDAVFCRPVAESLPRWIEDAVAEEPGVAPAALDFLAHGWDLWRFIELMDSWRNTSPSWWSVPATQRPPGWRRRSLASHWIKGAETLGDIVVELRERAVRQEKTRPVLDLEPCY